MNTDASVVWGWHEKIWAEKSLKSLKKWQKSKKKKNNNNNVFLYQLSWTTGFLIRQEKRHKLLHLVAYYKLFYMYCSATFNSQLQSLHIQPEPINVHMVGMEVPNVPNADSSKKMK